MSVYASIQDLHADRARWKRKNRIKQLKSSLNRYRDCTNLPFYCHELHAYKLLQELKHPGKKATADDWGRYRGALNRIRIHMVQAMGQAVREQERVLREENSHDETTGPL